MLIRTIAFLLVCSATVILQGCETMSTSAFSPAPQAYDDTSYGHSGIRDNSPTPW